MTKATRPETDVEVAAAKSSKELPQSYTKISAILVSVSLLYAFPGGYQATVTNTVQPLMEEFIIARQNRSTSPAIGVPVIMGAITAGHSFGSIFGCSAATILGERLGPLKTLSFVVSPIYVLGSVILSVSFITKSLASLFVGRVVFGFGE